LRRTDPGEIGEVANEASSMRRNGRFTVLLALGANAGVGVLKLLAGLISGSGALLSEAAHSASDCTTEVLLLVALRRSGRPADRAHPFGYGKERYFWSLLAAVAIFVSGAAFSVFEGLRTVLGPAAESDMLWINYPVLGLALVLEGTSFRQAVGRLVHLTRRRRLSLLESMRTPQDPTVNSVVLEDSTALVGIVVAAVGVGLRQLTGSRVWDGAASLTIGALLLVAAFVLARANQALLVGQQADPGLVRMIRARLTEAEEVDDVVDLLTMMVGTGRVLVCARVDFVDTLSAGELERACVRIDAELRERYSELDEIFIQPAPRSDRAVRERVQARYGRSLADE
jgi:cation diffusion facilitator family transporter